MVLMAIKCPHPLGDLFSNGKRQRRPRDGQEPRGFQGHGNIDPAQLRAVAMVREPCIS